MYHYSTAQTTTSFPEKLLDVFDTANLLYPQMRGGITGITGGPVVELVLNGNMTWHEVLQMRLSEEQADAELELARKVHESADINFTFSDRYRERLASVATLGLFDECTIVSARFAAEMLPDELPGIAATLPTGPHDSNSTEQQAAALILNRLDGESRPEAIALGMLWKASDQVLRASTARKLAREYRTTIASVSASGLPRKEREVLIKASKRLLGIVLRPLVEREIGSSVCEIQQTTGVNVHPTAIRGFVEALI